MGGTLFWPSALPTIAAAHWLITQSALYWQLTAHLSIRSLKHKLIKPYSGLRKDGFEPRQILNRVRCSCFDRSYGTDSDDICGGNLCMRMLMTENKPAESLTAIRRLERCTKRKRSYYASFYLFIYFSVSFCYILKRF